MKTQTEEQLKDKAQRRVDFKNHFLIYLSVNALLWIIWAVTGGGYIWPVWPTAGWGLAILIQYVGVYDPFSLFSVDKEIDKLRKENG